MTKYFDRNNQIISRDEEIHDNKTKLPTWLENFAKKLEKSSVHSKSEDGSIYDQISSILGTKSKFSTVQEVVDDMKKRSGLEGFLKSQSEKIKEKSNKKLAQLVQEIKDSVNSPKLFEELPTVKTFIDNFIHDRPGTSIEAVVNALENFFKSEINYTLVDDDLRRYINSEIGKIQKEKSSGENDLHIGKVDTSDIDTQSNDDMFKNLTPNKV